MDIRSLQRPLKDMYRQDPGSSQITLTARGTQADAPIACSCGLGARHLRGTAKRTKELVARAPEPARETCSVRRASRLRPDYLPNGRQCHGNTYRGDRCHRRGGPGSARDARNIQRSPSRVSEHPRHFRHPCTAGNGRAVKRVAGQNRTILRGDANPTASAAD